ncbi:MAG TPA: RecX family transcriptional regulator [Bryobacteraceae bacterium]|nr:RecX family transcriptional regulator [Bryobacteraceae bacterium]
MPNRDRTVRKLAGEELFQYGAKLLGGRALSSAELRTKLVRKAADPQAVDSIMERLREYGFVDDSRFAESFASARRESGSFGQMRVLRDLRGRRVAGSVAREAVDRAYEEFDERAAVHAWLERKYRGVNLTAWLQEEKHLASAFRKLRYAGFSSSSAIGALKNYAARADELEDEPSDG